MRPHLRPGRPTRPSPLTRINLRRHLRHPSCASSQEANSYTPGDSKQKIVLASSFGYGFVTELGNLHSRMKAGKAALTVPAGSLPVTPAMVQADKESTLVCATSDGYLLAFPLDDVPELTKGKGNKLINVPPKRLNSGEEYMIGMTVMAPKQEIPVWAGQRYLRMGLKDIEHFRGDRAKRGRKK